MCFCALFKCYSFDCVCNALCFGRFTRRSPGDVAGIKRYSEAMNAGDAYPLFAAMLTYKTWDTISGVTKTSKSTEDSGDSAKSNASASATSSSLLDVDRLKVTAYVESGDDTSAAAASGAPKAGGSGVKADPMLQHYAALYAQEIAAILSKIPRYFSRPRVSAKAYNRGCTDN